MGHGFKNDFRGVDKRLRESGVPRLWFCQLLSHAFSLDQISRIGGEQYLLGKQGPTDPTGIDRRLDRNLCNQPEAPAGLQRIYDATPGAMR